MYRLRIRKNRATKQWVLLATYGRPPLERCDLFPCDSWADAMLAAGEARKALEAALA